MNFHSVARRIVGVGAAAFLAAASVCCPVWAQDAPDPDAQSASQQESGPNDDDSSSAPQTFQPTAIGERSTASPYSAQDLVDAQRGVLDSGARAIRPSATGEFEDYVARLIGRRLPRYGQDLVLPAQRDFATPATAAVPPDYRLNVGDTVEISLTGSIGGTLEREIDTTGRIFLPSIGSVQLAGVRFGDLKDRISEAVGGQYRDFTVSVAIKQLRGIRVYVTGFANNPGAFTVSSLSTLANAVFQAGGPSSAGSFRSVKLYRDGQLVADFDLYQLLRDGNRIDDAVLQNGDVLFIPPAGEQVAVIGSIQQEAIYETLPGESLEAMLRIAGGINVLGDPDRLVVYSMRDPRVAGPQVVARSDFARTLAAGGDIVQVLSRGSLQQPIARQSIVVRIEGEVSRPGNYFLPPNTPISVIVEAAGGLTDRAYPFGAKLERQSVRAQQMESYQEAIRQLEFLLASAPLTNSAGLSTEQVAGQAAGARAILEQLRRTEPDGRVVMLVSPSADALPPSVLLENNDRILIPSRPTVVGVFGAVYRQGSFLIDGQPLRVQDYIERAGGAQQAADRKNIFVVRANGEVLTRKKGGLKAFVLPGDVIFVPVRTNTFNIWTEFRAATSILFQLAVTASAVNSLQ
ncbi:MAG: SLBB domain-containing protein [Caulobacter sp.]|nr:SLBB domain-containing protein [Caulobacter sp.]